MMMTPMRWINLTKRPTCSDLQWKHPTKADFVNWKPESIVECDIDGEWDVSKESNISFTCQTMHTFSWFRN